MNKSRARVEILSWFAAENTQEMKQYLHKGRRGRAGSRTGLRES